MFGNHLELQIIRDHKAPESEIRFTALSMKNPPFYALAVAIVSGIFASHVQGQDTVTYDIEPMNGDGSEVDYAVDSQDSGLSLGGAELSVEAEYSSSYLYRGVNFGDNAGIGTAKLAIPLAEAALITVGGRYVATGNDYSESQAFAELQIPMGPIAVFFGYRYLSGDDFGFTGFGYDDRSEIGTMIGTTLYGVNVGAGYVFDTGLDGSYVERKGSRKWDIIGPVALRAIASASFGFDYQFDGSGLNNLEAGLEMPVSISEFATLAPFVSASFAGDDLEIGEDTVVGGVSLKVTF